MNHDNLKCKNCIYFDSTLGSRVGGCRFDPPRVIPGYVESIGQYAMTEWPEVDGENDWCGKLNDKVPELKFIPVDEISPSDVLWDDAPEWAKYIAMDSDGEWYWYKNQPYFNDYEWRCSKGGIRYAGKDKVIHNFNWQLALFKRE